ncbi:MAG: Aspartate-semialdehyde dehydrogenase [Candidatus Anoxychlamydiales bacterium]|nr:Aspartate-semialdehyde dehydrogenase [Candidatus Anoxychlamydiales bacterium]
MSYNIAVVGATGIVGCEFLKLLDKSNLKINNLLLFASEKSINKKIVFRKKNYFVKALNLENLKNVDFAIFAAGSKISNEFLPKLENKKIHIIDLSSAFRQKKHIPLVIPEINAHLLKNPKNRIISSPNCTTTIMLIALFDLHKKFKIKRIVASTYQAASGGGKKLIDKLFNDTKNTIKNPNAKNLYGFNLFLHESEINAQKYSEEEMKMIFETHKILNDDSIKITATCVRVPTIRAHSLSLNVEFEKKFLIDEIYKILKANKNIKIFEDFENNSFATPQIVTNQNEVFVSRIRQDLSNPKAIDMWVCSDQILKGASLNAFQILEILIKQR